MRAIFRANPTRNPKTMRHWKCMQLERYKRCPMNVDKAGMWPNWREENGETVYASAPCEVIGNHTHKDFNYAISRLF